jgi:DEAD/DEAH box helicase domain-containing protein
MLEEISAYREYQRRPRLQKRMQPLPHPYQYRLATRGFWLDIDRAVRADVDCLVSAQLRLRAYKDCDDVLAAALHGLEHLLIALVPTVALCDRRDLGCFHQADLSDQAGTHVIIYDYHEGGIGLAEAGHRHIARLLARAYDTVAQCPCTSGCPYCIHASWCYEENHCLDKESTVYLLGRLLSRPTTVVPPPGASPQQVP